MTHKEPLGKPKYSKGIQAVDCGLNIVVECDAKICGVINVKKDDEIDKQFIAATLTLCKKNDDSDCDEAGNDYRDANNNEPYINLKGFEFNCDSRTLNVAHYSIFPKEGQSLEELYDSVKTIICNCVNPPAQPSQPVNNVESANDEPFNTGNTFNGQEIWCAYYEFVYGNFSGQVFSGKNIPDDFGAFYDLKYLQVRPNNSIVNAQIILGEPTAGAAIDFFTYNLINLVGGVESSPTGTTHKLWFYYTKA